MRLSMTNGESKMKYVSKIKETFSLVLMIFAINGNVQAEEIGVFIYVDQGVLDQRFWLDEASITNTVNSWINGTNTRYRDSLVNIELKNLGVQFVDIQPDQINVNVDDILSGMQGATGVFSELYNIADERGADYIYTIVENYDDDDICGKAISVNLNSDISSSNGVEDTEVANTNIIIGGIVGLIAKSIQKSTNVSETRWAIATSEIGCGVDTFAHELGHTMGLAHGDQVAECFNSDSHRTGIKSYGKGWGDWDCDTDTQNNDEFDEFGTIMAGNYIFGTDAEDHTRTISPRVDLFSNPNVVHADCGSNDVCGNASNGDSARVLNEFRNNYASHESADASWLDYTDGNLKSCLTENYEGVEVDDLKMLFCVGKEISQIEGIEQLDALSYIDLSNNNISVIAPILTLLSGRNAIINLAGNDYVLCHQLNELDAMSNVVLTKSDKCFDVGVMIVANSILLN